MTLLNRRSQIDQTNQIDPIDEILVISFGTSYEKSRNEDIGAVEAAIARAFPQIPCQRAFTARGVLRQMQRQGQEPVMSVAEALQEAKERGVRHLLVQPTHLLAGTEYDMLLADLHKYVSAFEEVRLGQPLFGPLAEDPGEYSGQMKDLMEIFLAQMAQDAGGKREDPASAFVLMGHGSDHRAHIVYRQLQALVAAEGWDNVFLATVEGDHESTRIEGVIDQVKAGNYKHIFMRPLMLVAGDHAYNDMAGEEDSWREHFYQAGFDHIDCQIAGMGRIPGIQQIYVQHAREAELFRTSQ